MNKNKKLRKIAPVALAGLVLIGASAWLTNTETQTGVNKIKSGTMVVKFVDTSETIKREDTVINLSGAQMIPMTEKFAVENLNAYNFTLKNSGDVDVTYTLYLVSDGSEFAPSILNIDMDGKFEGVDNKAPQSVTVMEKDARQAIDTGIIKAKESITYNQMRLFAHESAVVQDMLNNLNGDMVGRVGNFHLELEAEQVKTGDEVKTGSTKFTDGTVLNWEDTKKPENGEKYGYNAEAVMDDRLLDSAFENCDQLEEITLPSTMTTLGNNSLAGTGLTKVDIPEGVTTVGNNALANNNKLTTVKLPSTLTTLGSNVVSGSPNISNITYNGTQEDLDKVNKGEDALPTDKVEVKPSTPIDTPEIITSLSASQAENGDLIITAPKDKIDNLMSGYVGESNSPSLEPAYYVGIKHQNYEEGAIGNKTITDLNVNQHFFEQVDETTIKTSKASLVNNDFVDGEYTLTYKDNKNTVNEPFASPVTLNLGVIPNQKTHLTLNGDVSNPTVGLTTKLDQSKFSLVADDGTVISNEDWSISWAKYNPSINLGSEKYFASCGEDELFEQDAIYRLNIKYNYIAGENDIDKNSIVVNHNTLTINPARGEGLGATSSDGSNMPLGYQSRGYANFASEEFSLTSWVDTELTSPGAKFSDNKVLSWDELKLASNGEKYGYDASLISDNSISANTFKFNNQLSEIFIPSTVQTIGDYAFSGVNLNKVTLSEGVVTIGQEAFWRTSVSEVLIPSSVTSIGDSAFSSNDNLSKVEFAPNSKLSSISFMSFAKCPNLASIEIPSSLKTISSFAFEKSGLTSIKLNEGLEDIGNNAFDGTKITKLDLPTTLKNISFYDSTQIKEVSFANGTTTFPSLISSISLETVSLPSTITKIDARQFADSSKLTTIKYGGTMAQWDSLEKGWDWDENTSLKQIICSDGTIKLGIINVDGIEYDFNKEELEDLTSLLSSNNNTSHFALGEGDKLLFRKDVSQISLSTNPSLWKKITTPEGNYVYKNDVTSLTSYKSKNVISINIDNTIEQIDLNDYFELKRIDNLDYNTTAKFASKKTDNGLVLMYKTNLGWKEVQLEGYPISCNAYENLYTSITNEKTYTTTSYNASVLNINLDGKTYNINPSNLTEATILNVQVSGISPKDNTTQFMFINKRLAFRENTSNSPTSITSWKYLTKQQEYPDKTSWCGSLYQDDLQSLEDQSIIDDYSASLIKEISIDGQVINYNVSEIIPTLTSENMEKGKYSLQGIKFATVQGNYDYLVFNLDSDYDETSSASREWKYINKPENANTYGEYLQSLYYVPYDQLVFTSSSAFTTYNDAILPSWDASQPIRLSQLKDYKTTEMASYGNTYALDGEYVVCKTQYSFNSPNSWQYLVKDNNANELSKIKLSELKNYNGKIDTLIRNTNSNNLKGYFPISEN